MCMIKHIIPNQFVNETNKQAKYAIVRLGDKLSVNKNKNRVAASWFVTNVTKMMQHVISHSCNDENVSFLFSNSCIA